MMQNSPNARLFTWDEIAFTPSIPGVYSWYYQPELTRRDIELLIKDLSSIDSGSQTTDAIPLVEKFLKKRIFDFFYEEEYTAFISGPLKPHYEGVLQHRPSPSSSLVNRIIENPARLFTLKKVIENCAPFFSSPIYIGMSDNLNRRLNGHKSLIEHLREISDGSVSDVDICSTRDAHSFAMEIVNRNFLPNRLMVYILPFELDEKSYVDAENVLNRINFPILGRN